jgi:hypothetical protein
MAILSHKEALMNVEISPHELLALRRLAYYVRAMADTFRSADAVFAARLRTYADTLDDVVARGDSEEVPYKIKGRHK